MEIYTLKTEATLGPDFDNEQLQKELMGKRYNDALDYLKSQEQVNQAEISLSPFWVFKLPKKADQIHIQVIIPENNES